MEGDEGRETFKKERRWRGMRKGRCLKRKGDGGGGKGDV